MANYRVSFLRTNGWTRLGMAGAAGAVFLTPMLWAMGSFGAAEESIHRAIIFAVAGLWLFIAVGYLVGWALQGFVVRQKVVEEESEDGPAHRPAPPPPSRPAPPKGGAH